MDAVLNVKGATKEFFRKGRDQAGAFAAVADANLALRKGSLVACMGRSGSGKTTLMNMMAGLLAPTRGTVEFDGTSLYSLDDARLSRVRNSSIGVVPQGQTPVHSLSMVQNIMLPASLYGCDDPRSLEERALELADQLGLRALADSYPAELSGGELRRMAVARALLGEPAVVLADEPTGDLDQASTQLVLGMLRACANRGAAVFVVTHDNDVLEVADETVHMDAGRLSTQDAS